MEIVKTNQLKIVIITAVKNRCILHGRVFVMSVLIFIEDKGRVSTSFTNDGQSATLSETNMS